MRESTEKEVGESPEINFIHLDILTRIYTKKEEKFFFLNTGIQSNLLLQLSSLKETWHS